MANGWGFGKIILFGEHFVVHGLPCIATSLKNKAIVRVEKKSEHPSTIVDNQPKFPGVQTLSWELCKAPVEATMKFLGIKDPLTITLSGDLPVAHHGLGTSAANFVAFVRAIDELYDLKLQDEEVCRAAYEGEKILHGEPSGIDNTIATHGGFLWFQKEKHSSQNIIKNIPLTKPLFLVLVDSGKSCQTRDVVESVDVFKKSHPQDFQAIAKGYESLANQAFQALSQDNHQDLGLLFNENHTLLKHLGVSCPELEKVVQLTKKAGAIGAKLTGTGKGGLVVALTSDESHQKSISKKLVEFGYPTFETTISSNSNIDTKKRETAISC